MNLSLVISRVLIVAAVVLAGNISAVEFCKPAFFVVGSVLINEKNSAALLGEEYISARKQVIIGKVLVGGLANLKTNFSTSRRSDNPVGPCIIVNGALRVGGDYLSLDEKFIDKKCDEVFLEDVVWVAKPIVNGLVDFAYDYVTLEIVKGIITVIGCCNISNSK